jgi:Protein of unknown function (DUF4127)
MHKSKFILFALFIFLLALPLQAQKKTKPVARKKPAPTPAPAPKTPEPVEEIKPVVAPPVPRNPNAPAGRIVLIPLDDRPAVAQFAQMIGGIADHEVVMPPMEMLGRFTTPGNVPQIIEWLGLVDYSKYKNYLSTKTEPKYKLSAKDVFTPEDRAKTLKFIKMVDYSDVSALVVSVDMLAYGGLVASREPGVTQQEALSRLDFFRWFKHEHPEIPIYAFNVLMRVAPTASSYTRNWRDDVSRWAELMDRAPKTNDPKLIAELEQLKKKLNPQSITNYLEARRRDLQVNLAMIKLYEDRVIDNLIFLQDDAREFGLHRHDQVILREKLKGLGFTDEVPIYNGADEGSLSLVSRAVLDKAKQKIKIAVVYSSEKSRKIIAPYEDHPLEFTVEHQINAAGGQLVNAAEAPDYTLYVNAPETNATEFTMFSKNLVADLKANKAVALADVLFPAPHFSGADERLISILKTEKLFDKLTGYAAWNTAGNTLGTTIPAANMRVFSKQFTDAPERAARATTAHLEFLLHRFAGDYLYHDIVRLEINQQLRKPPAVPTDEFTEEMYNRINKQTQEKLQPLIETFFTENFKGRSYSLGNFNGANRNLKINQLNRLKIFLPWPRTFESTIEYKFDASLQ